MKPIDLALSYLDHGWPIFPCRHETIESVDQYGEINTLGEKTPLTHNGFKGATKLRRIVERWWSDNPDAAVGIPTGSAIGAFVLDIDAKPGGANGFDWLDEMEQEHGPLPETARVTSPNGGLHIYFKYAAGTRNRGALGAGVDVRSEGGYVLAAGSVMSGGRAYKWTPESETVPPIADAPQWLLDLLLPQKITHVDYTPSLYGNAPYVEAAVYDELRKLAGAGKGTRNNALNDTAFALGTFVGAGQLSRSDAERELQAIAAPWGDFSKSCGTIRRGLDAGAANPRHIPEPQQQQQDNTRLVDIRRMIANGLAKHDVTGTAPATEPEPVEPKPAPEEPRAAITATSFKWIDPKTLPRREFAYGAHLIRKYVSVTVAPGGIGKTNLSVAESLAMASGRDLLGTKPPSRTRCWIFNAEDPRDELERRIMASCLHYKLKPKDLDGYLFLDTGREQELCVAVEDRKSGIKYQEPIIEAVVDQIKRNAIDVMIVDPFVSTHSVNENDNGAIDKVAKLWAHIADETNCAIDIVHHLRKVSDREATVEDARGAVSLIGAARSVRVLNRMSADQAKEAGVGSDERFGYFSVTYGKSNLTPLSSRLDWRHLVSVPLGNGSGLTKPQDHAPVAVKWEWPTKTAMAESVPHDKAALVRTRINNGQFAYNYQSAEWAGYAVADIMGIELPGGQRKSAEHRKVERLIDGWIECGMLCKIERTGLDVRHPDRKTFYVEVPR